MGKKVLLVALAAVILLGTMGCMAHVHHVGQGSKHQGMPEMARQWYILWGIVPINNVDTGVMARGATDYTIRTWVSPLDFIINIFTGYVSIYSRTVEVLK